jgi:homoserine O-acetyltransferase
MVDAAYHLLTQKLNIKHLKGIIGTSMGGFLALQWAVKYPDFMDFIIPITTSSTSKGQNYAISTIMNNYIKNDPDYKEGKYEHKPQTGPQNAMMMLYLFGFSPAYYKSSSNEEVLESIHEMEIEGANSDANDIVWQNEATMIYDVSCELHKIKARTLVIGINQDQYFPPDTDVIPLSKSIKGSKLVLYDSILGHVGSSEIKKAEDTISDFLKSGD